MRKSEKSSFTTLQSTSSTEGKEADRRGNRGAMLENQKLNRGDDPRGGRSWGLQISTKERSSRKKRRQSWGPRGRDVFVSLFRRWP